MGRTIYLTSVVLTAVFLFWPILYGNIRVLQKLPGNPAVQAILGVLVFGALAYLTYEGDSGKGEKEITASG